MKVVWRRQIFACYRFVIQLQSGLAFCLSVYGRHILLAFSLEPFSFRRYLISTFKFAAAYLIGIQIILLAQILRIQNIFSFTRFIVLLAMLLRSIFLPLCKIVISFVGYFLLVLLVQAPFRSIM
jgi:hypothetical protein